MLTCRAGAFKRPLFEADGTTCIGIETVDGTKYQADKVVLAAGAWTSTLVDLEDQCVSKVRELLVRQRMELTLRHGSTHTCNCLLTKPKTSKTRR